MAKNTIPKDYRTFKYRLLLKKGQYKELSFILESQRLLYNAALEERITCYEKTGKGRSYIDQCKAVTELRKDIRYSNVPTNLQRWTLKRLDEAYKGFFKRGGFPRFRSKTRWKSFGFAEASGFTFKNGRVKFKGIRGSLKVHLHRPTQGAIRSCAFKKDAKGWYICFQCEISRVSRVHTGEAVGVDVGLKTFATMSDHTTIANPRIARKAHKIIRKKQRALARCEKNSKRRNKIRVSLERAHGKIKNTRKTFLHQQSAKLVKKYSTIVVEDLKIKNMIKNHCLARSISDAGWGEFIDMLSYKAASAGGEVIKVNPRNTSQSCSSCGLIVKKGLSVRVHKCDCGLVLDRDINASINILNRGGIIPKVANVDKIISSVHLEKYTG